MIAQELYEGMVTFAIAHGLRREEQGSGWWWGEQIQEECGLGEAVEFLIREKYRIDVRDAIQDEPREYWG